MIFPVTTIDEHIVHTYFVSCVLKIQTMIETEQVKQLKEICFSFSLFSSFFIGSQIIRKQFVMQI